MTKDELRALPFGSVVCALNTGKYYRKGRGETWHPISQVDGQRYGQQDSIRTSYLEMLVGPVSDADAQSEYLSTIKERRNT